jgi:hypothetical protein
MSDDDMHGLDRLDAETEARLAKDAVARYASECLRAGKAVRAVHKTSVDAVEVVLADDKGNAIARYPWIYDAVVGLARLR